MTRVLGGSKGRITTLPFPGSRWTDARDLPVLPKQSFREWWATDHAAHEPAPPASPDTTGGPR